MKILFIAASIPTLAYSFTHPSAFAKSNLGSYYKAPSSLHIFGLGQRDSSNVILRDSVEGGSETFEKKKIIVLGGDGFCGWPTSLHLSDQGHDIVIADNLSRRNIDTELGCSSLTPIQPPEVRS